MPANDDISVKILDKNSDISLVLGGPLYQFFRKAKLSGPAGEMLWRRIVAVTMVAWLPLPILTLIGGQALHGIIAWFGREAVALQPDDDGHPIVIQRAMIAEWH